MNDKVDIILQIKIKIYCELDVNPAKRQDFDYSVTLVLRVLRPPESALDTSSSVSQCRVNSSVSFRSQRYTGARCHWSPIVRLT